MSARVDRWLRILTATGGTLPPALFAGEALARFLPLAESPRVALGTTLVIPLWVTAMCFAFLARSGTRALLVCLLAGGAAAALVYGVPS